jgi:hypothetical protein
MRRDRDHNGINRRITKCLIVAFVVMQTTVTSMIFGRAHRIAAGVTADKIAQHLSQVPTVYPSDEPAPEER